MNTQISAKDFGLNHPRACITGEKNKDKYMDYQDEYRKEYGVFPELDRINNPFTAKWNDLYNMCCDLRKSGVKGALWYHDLHAIYRKKLRYIYETFGNEWSFIISIDFKYRPTLTDILLMPTSEHIVNNLGYRKDESGNYFEGTWEDGKLIYGLVYLANQDIFYVGSFDESGNTRCGGVYIDITEEKKDRQTVIVIVGEFIFRKDALVPDNDICVELITNIKQGKITSIETNAGQYDSGYAEGKFICKSFSDEIQIGWTKYKDGEEKSSMSNISKLPRFIMMLYMLAWYFLKYTYGCILLILPLYYHSRKKNWKI